MDPLPLPPPPPAVELRSRPLRLARAGQLTTAWRVVFVVGWAGVALGFGAVAKSSRTTGLSTWWLGPSSDPSNIVLVALPFVIAAAMVVLGFRNVPYVPFAGMLAAVALAAIATGDLGRFDALAQVELATALAGLLVSVAALAGMLRPAAPAPEIEAALAAGVAAHPAHAVPPPPSSSAIQAAPPTPAGPSAPPTTPAE